MNEKLNIGFTGSRKGMSFQQMTTLKELMHTLTQGRKSVVFRHGDCIGSDATAHDLVRAYHPSVTVYVNPPDNPSYRAFRHGDHTLPEKGYLERNRAIVDASELLIATPKGTELTRSGTWSTIRYARKEHKTVYVLWADGTVTKEDNG